MAGPDQMSIFPIINSVRAYLHKLFILDRPTDYGVLPIHTYKSYSGPPRSQTYIYVDRSNGPPLHIRDTPIYI